MVPDFKFALLAQFRSPTVELKKISESFLGLKPATAMQRAKACDLPFPTFKLLKSERAPMMVAVDDLAEYMEKKACAGTKRMAVSAAALNR